MPAGITLRPVYESLRDEILDDLRAAMPVDAVLLIMHGAMVAQGYDDCEGDLAERVRQIVGEDVPVGVELDLHCHLTQQLIEHADAVVTFKEYPHVDPPDRAIELFDIIAGAAEGRTRPVTSMYDCRMIGFYPTTRQPIKNFVDKMKSLEGKDGVLSVSLGHGFPWGDVADTGTRVLVVTDNRPDEGAELAKSLGEEFFGMRATAQPNFRSVDDALDEALTIDGESGGAGRCNGQRRGRCAQRFDIHFAPYAGTSDRQWRNRLFVGSRRRRRGHGSGRRHRTGHADRWQNGTHVRRSG